MSEKKDDIWDRIDKMFKDLDEMNKDHDEMFENLNKIKHRIFKLDIREICNECWKDNFVLMTTKSLRDQ